MLFQILTGLSLGALHVLSGPDHLAAVAPLCRGELVISQVMPESPDGQPALLYVFAVAFGFVCRYPVLTPTRRRGTLCGTSDTTARLDYWTTAKTACRTGAD